MNKIDDKRPIFGKRPPVCRPWATVLAAGAVLILAVIVEIVLAVRLLTEKPAPAASNYAPSEYGSPYPSAAPVPDTGASFSRSDSAGAAADDWGAKPSELDRLLYQAKYLAAGYDYEAAVRLLAEDPVYRSDPAVAEAIAEFEAKKAALVPVDVMHVTHVFFHTLIMDTGKAFDGDYKETGYNQMMTTGEEFQKILQSMYDRGYVLVRLHDLAHEEVGEDGVARMVLNDLRLPEGKTPFILSQDDVCYYEYMEGDGFASRMVVGPDGKPACEILRDDGSVDVGDYDLVPMLDRFVEDHPDFSYKGAKGVIGLTGYNGILGYRTASSYSASPTFEEDRRTAARVVRCLRDDGWEIASHSWGHPNMGTIPMDEFIEDTDKWKAEVESLTGPTDIILFPFGSDIGDWRPYGEDNQRLLYLKGAGFRYFCNVDASRQTWIQIGQDHFRQGRRNLDGYRMYYNPDNLSDLFDAAGVFDLSRPLPVPPMKE